MDDLIPIAFFVFAWLMAAAGSRKKQQQRRQGQDQPRPPRPPDARQGSSGERPQRGRDLIPESIWEEIEALASGKPRPTPRAPEPVDPPAPERPHPEPVVQLPASVEGAPAPLPPARTRPLPTRTRTPRPRTGSQATSRELDYPPSRPPTDLVPISQGRAVRRAPAAEVVVVEEPEPEVAEERSRRTEREPMWGGLSEPGAARRAIILKEVLGPPLAARDPRDLAG